MLALGAMHTQRVVSGTAELRAGDRAATYVGSVPGADASMRIKGGPSQSRPRAISSVKLSEPQLRRVAATRDGLTHFEQ
jgi:hypothetical protein